MIEQYIEALIFSSDTAIRLQEIILCLQASLGSDFSEEQTLKHIDNIKKRYDDQESALELVKIAGGYQFLTRLEMAPIIQQLHLQRSKKKLSQSAMETLAIIAYKQPITKVEVEQIRGVNCDYTVQKLLDKDLIQIAGKAEGPGRPILYELSAYFMDYFGINSIDDLPQAKDLVTTAKNEIGYNGD